MHSISDGRLTRIARAMSIWDRLTKAEQDSVLSSVFLADYIGKDRTVRRNAIINALNDKIKSELTLIELEKQEKL